MGIGMSKENKQKSVAVFCCYAHEDEELLKKLKIHLSSLQREGLITVWHDGNVSAGAFWEDEIKQNLNKAQIILLLISSDFMNSQYCYDVEMEHALKRHENGEATVIPIILRPTDWHIKSLDKLQALPKDAKPVSGRDWHSLDEAFVSVTGGIRKAVETILKNFPASSLTSFDVRYDREDIPTVNGSIDGRSNAWRILFPSFFSFTDGIRSSMRKTHSSMQKIQKNAKNLYQSLPPSLHSNKLSSATIVIILLCILLLSIQICLLNINPFTIIVSILVTIPVLLAPLFLGAKFGCWAGSLTGGVGIFLGTLLANISAILSGLPTSASYGLPVSMSVNIAGMLNMDLALMGFLIGLIWYSKYNASFSFRSFIRLEILSLLAAIIASFITYPYVNFYYSTYDRIFKIDTFKYLIYQSHDYGYSTSSDAIFPLIIFNIFEVILFSAMFFMYRKIKKRKERNKYGSLKTK